MFCKKCGEKLNDNAIFCVNCGKKVEVTAEQSPIKVFMEDIPYETPSHTITSDKTSEYTHSLVQDTEIQDTSSVFDTQLSENNSDISLETESYHNDIPDEDMIEDNKVKSIRFTEVFHLWAKSKLFLTAAAFLCLYFISDVIASISLFSTENILDSLLRPIYPIISSTLVITSIAMIYKFSKTSIGKMPPSKAVTFIKIYAIANLIRHIILTIASILIVLNVPLGKTPVINGIVSALSSNMDIVMTVISQTPYMLVTLASVTIITLWLIISATLFISQNALLFVLSKSVGNKIKKDSSSPVKALGMFTTLSVVIAVVGVCTSIIQIICDGSIFYAISMLLGSVSLVLLSLSLCHFTINDNKK